MGLAEDFAAAEHGQAKDLELGALVEVLVGVVDTVDLCVVYAVHLLLGDAVGLNACVVWFGAAGDQVGRAGVAGGSDAELVDGYLLLEPFPAGLGGANGVLEGGLIDIVGGPFGG